MLEFLKRRATSPSSSATTGGILPGTVSRATGNERKAMTSYFVCIIWAVVGLILGTIVAHLNGKSDREELKRLRTETCEDARKIEQLEELVAWWAHSSTLDDSLEAAAREISKADEKRRILREKRDLRLKEQEGQPVAEQMGIAFAGKKDQEDLDFIEEHTKRLLQMFWVRHDYAVKKGLIAKPFPSWRNFLLTRGERAKLIEQ